MYKSLNVEESEYCVLHISPMALATAVHSRVTVFIVCQCLIWMESWKAVWNVWSVSIFWAGSHKRTSFHTCFLLLSSAVPIHLPYLIYDSMHKWVLCRSWRGYQMYGVTRKTGDTKRTQELLIPNVTCKYRSMYNSKKPWGRASKITLATLRGTFLFTMMGNYHNNWRRKKVPNRKEESSSSRSDINPL